MERIAGGGGGGVGEGGKEMQGRERGGEGGERGVELGGGGGVWNEDGKYVQLCSVGVVVPTAPYSCEGGGGVDPRGVHGRKAAGPSGCPLSHLSCKPPPFRTAASRPPV